MYMITLYDNNCSPICDGVARFFTEDLVEFERNWRPHAGKEQLKRYERSKTGKIVTDYCSDSPELNIVQEDKNAEILFEKNLIFQDKLYTLLNAYNWEDEIYAAETHVVFRGIKFKEQYFLIGRYKMNGVCQKKFLSTSESGYETITAWGNPVINCKVQEKQYCYQTGDGREHRIYHKEDFKEDSLETYCWVTVVKCSKEELLNGSIDLEAEETMICLMRDIPGEAG